MKNLKSSDLKEKVNHPSHYEKSCSLECIDAMEMMMGPDLIYFCLGNCIKYLWRCRSKNGMEDLKKTKWYLNKSADLSNTYSYENLNNIINLIKKLSEEMILLEDTLKIDNINTKEDNKKSLEVKPEPQNNTYIRPTKDEYYINIAKAVSLRSTCLRRRYGCVIVKDDIIVSTGYNGSPRGRENCCDLGFCKRENEERYKGYDNCVSVHAEQNALIAASHEEIKGATLYISCDSFDSHEEVWIPDEDPIPCRMCRDMIRNSGIKRIVNIRGDVNV